MTERDFWRVVGKTQGLLATGIDLERALEQATATVTTELGEWQAEF